MTTQQLSESPRSFPKPRPRSRSYDALVARPRRSSAAASTNRGDHGRRGIASEAIEIAAAAGVGRTRRGPARREALKRAFDLAGAAAAGLLLSPLMLLVAVLLFIEGGPVIFRQRRIGRDGAVFECLKFRSMIPGAEQSLREMLEQRPELRREWLCGHKLRRDPRITAIGRILRRTSLDELPQLWNVLRGDMSLVGPRPIVREEMLRYGQCLPLYLSAKPGITGLWQVSGRNDTDYRRRVALDVYYVRKRSAWLDLYILLKTARALLGSGAY